MTKLIVAAMSLLLVLAASSASARDDLTNFPIKEALESNAASKLMSIPTYFGSQGHKKAKRSFGEFRTNKKTNAFNKSDKQACEIAFISALYTLQQRAQKEGGNAVVAIKSNYKNKEFSSATEYQCGAGNVMAGVALKGTIVKIGD